ncbi:MAG: PKD domain-containing protein [Cytophagaceae bacterium]|jgi:hypothetical protein|nr:PKD domain-containing protein [Cytophagaceae bacterium]
MNASRLVFSSLFIVVFLLISCREKNKDAVKSADFTYRILENGEVEFTANQSMGDQIKYAWNFGDGQTLSASSDLKTVRHFFSSDGSYQVNLKVTGNDEKYFSTTKEASQSVTIGNVPNRVKIVSMQLVSYDPDYRWDPDNSDPDVYVKICQHTTMCSNQVVKSSTSPDVSQSNLPLTFILSPSLELQSSTPLSFGCFDDDGFGLCGAQEDLQLLMEVGTYSLDTFRSLSNNDVNDSYPSSYQLKQGKTTIRLGLEWYRE